MQYSNFFALLLIGAGVLCFIGYAIDPDKDQTNLYLGVVLLLVVFISATFQYRMEAKYVPTLGASPFLQMTPSSLKTHFTITHTHSYGEE